MSYTFLLFRIKKMLEIMQVTDIDYEIFSLPKKEVKIMNKYMFKDKQLRVKIKWKVIKHKCPKCWRYNTKRVWNWYETVIVNHMFLSNYTTVQLEVEKRRFKCLDCEKNKWWNDQFWNKIEWSTFSEKFSFLNYKCSYSNVFKTFILREWEYSSISELSRKFKVWEKKIYAVINETTIEELEMEKIEYMLSLPKIVIWIDEFSFSWRDYLLQINDLESKKVIWILRSKDNKLLEYWLKSLPIEVIKKITWIGTDMNTWFKNVIQKHILKRTWKTLEKVKQTAKSSVDHYHLKQLMTKLIMEVFSLSNWMIKAGHYDKVIKDLTRLETKSFNKYREDRLEFNVREFREYRPNCDEYKPITLGFFLSKKYSTLLLKRSEDLTKKQEHRLNQILFEFDPKWYIRETYLWKEMLNEAIDKKDMDLIEKLINDFKSSIQYKIQACWKTLEKWKDEIKNFFETWITNAFTEWKNTKAKLFKRMAYWYKKKDNYIKKLLICL